MSAAIQVTAKMMDARDTMRRFFGDRYDAETAPYRETIRGIVRDKGKSALDAGLELCKRAAQFAEDTGGEMVLPLAIAATVEECEQGGRDRPTPQAKTY